jgi:hypothetical protein
LSSSIAHNSRCDHNKSERLTRVDLPYHGHMSSWRASCLAGSVSVIVACQIAVAQQPSKHATQQRSANAAITTINLGSNAGPPGSVAVLPIYFKPANGIEVGSLTIQVRFPAATLKFEKLEPGPQFKSVQLSSDIATTKDPKGVATTTVTISALTSAANSEAKGIPAGMLASLSLKLNDKAPHGTVPLRTSAQATALGANEELSGVRAGPAHIEVQWVDAPPSVTCFLFSH